MVGAEAAYRRAIESNPNFASAHFNLGNILVQKKDMAGAKAEYRRVIEIDPAICVADWIKNFLK